MSESVTLPALGESVTEGTVTRWLKSVGDNVEVDEPLLEVSTDKVDTEIPSPVAGVIEEILVQEDETVEVGAALVRIGDGSGAGGESPEPASEQSQPEAQEAEGAEQTQAPAETPEQGQAETSEEEASGTLADDSTAAPSTEAPAPAPTPEAADREETPEEASSGDAESATVGETTPQTSTGYESTRAEDQQASSSSAAAASAPAAPADSSLTSSGYVTPIVRKLANERGVDLATVSGTGVGGRIRKEDVIAAAEAAQQPAEEQGQQQPVAGARPEVEVSPLRGTTAPMSRLRKVVAERAVQSMQSTAQLTSVVEVDVTRVAALRAKTKDAFFDKHGVKLSFLPFFALAATEALKTYPIINATVDGDSIVYPDTENLSIAVDTERGLLTPVVKGAGDLDIPGLAREIADLAERTRENKLKPDELAGGTFTLTNTGSRGALFDTPVVFLPQVAILGTGIVTKRPVVVTDGGYEAVAIRSMVYLALSYDHRIVDGADASRFLVAVKNRLEAGEFEADLSL